MVQAQRLGKIYIKSQSDIMLENFDTISELNKKRQEYGNVVARFCEPLLKDTIYMGDIYQASQNGYFDPVEERRAFIFVVLFFYFPKKLLSMEKCRTEVVQRMCELTHCSQSLVSFDSRDLLFQYKHYKSFRDLVNRTINRAVQILGSKGINAKLYVTRFGNEEKEN